MEISIIDEDGYSSRVAHGSTTHASKSLLGIVQLSLKEQFTNAKPKPKYSKPSETKRSKELCNATLNQSMKLLDNFDSTINERFQRMDRKKSKYKQSLSPGSFTLPTLSRYNAITKLESIRNWKNPTSLRRQIDHQEKPSFLGPSKSSALLSIAKPIGTTRTSVNGVAPDQKKSSKLLDHSRCGSDMVLGLKQVQELEKLQSLANRPLLPKNESFLKYSEEFQQLSDTSLSPIANKNPGVADRS